MPLNLELPKEILCRIATMRPSYLGASILIETVRFFIYFVLLCP